MPASYTASVDKQSVDILVYHLKQLEGNAMNKLRNELKRNMKPLNNQILSNVPIESPFKGMRQNYYGRVQWQHPKATTRFSPYKRGRMGWSNLVTIELTGVPRLGFDYTENAGARRRKPRPVSKQYQRRTDSVPRSHSVTTQGDELIAKARSISKYNFKAGHFAYGKFLSLRPQMITIALTALNKTASQFNAKVWF